LYVWGYNYYGQLGLGDTNNRTTPHKLKFSTPICGISCGYNHSMLVDKQGNVFTWGNNVNGELGLGHTIHQTAPTRVDLGTAVITAVACGANHSMALDTNGEVWCWGYNEQGQLGIGDYSNRLTPQHLPLDFPAVAIGCGGCHSLVLDKNGDVWGFGFNGNGELGSGDSQNRLIPGKIEIGCGKVTSISCGYNHSIVLNQKGECWIWGFNAYGQLGLGDTNRRVRPEKLKFDFSVSQLGGGGLYSMFVDTHGNLYSCGHNGNGELGLGNTKNFFSPQRIDAIRDVASLACCYNHTLVVDTHGDIYVWGKNESGQLGLVDTYPLHMTPTKLPIKGFLKKKQTQLYFTFPERTQATFADLNFKTQDGKIFLVHSAIIAHRCPILSKSDTKTIPLTSSVFKLFIDFIYETMPSDSDLIDQISLFDIVALLHFSKLYSQKDVASFCQNYLLKNMTKKDLNPILEQLYLLNETLSEVPPPGHSQALVLASPPAGVLDADDDSGAVEDPHAHDLQPPENLSLELDWCVSYLGKHNILPSIRSLKKFSDDFGEKILKEFHTPSSTFTTFPVVKPTSIRSTLNDLFVTGLKYDFKIKIGNSSFLVHKCILCKWEYFKLLLLSDLHEVTHKTNMPEA
jgi:alpha-tubulin suppressor-like RCC1 family protein